MVSVLFWAKGMNKSKDADKINAGCILCELECSRLSLVLSYVVILLLHFFLLADISVFLFFLLVVSS